MQLALGVWVAVSPWLLGASARTPISWSNVVSGVAVALIGLWGLLSERREDEAGSVDEPQSDE
jgi:hypothetical protein